MNSSTRPPAVVVVTLSIDELRAMVRDVVREALTQQAPVASAAPLVDRHDLARLLGVSAATIARMTAEGMPHVFAGAAPRYAADEVDNNPVAAVRTPKMREVKKERVILTDDEFARLVGCAEVDLELRMMALVARCEGGMRTGDLNRWDWTMIDRVHFAECFVPRAKTATPQALTIPEVLAPFLRAWWERAGKPEAGPVFPVRIGKRAGEPKRPSNTYAKRLRRDLFRAGVWRARPVEVPRQRRARAWISANMCAARSSRPIRATRSTSRPRPRCPSTFTPSVAPSARPSPRRGQRAARNEPCGALRPARARALRHANGGDAHRPRRRAAGSCPEGAARASARA